MKAVLERKSGRIPLEKIQRSEMRRRKKLLIWLHSSKWSKQQPKNRKSSWLMMKKTKQSKKPKRWYRPQHSRINRNTISLYRAYRTFMKKMHWQIRCFMLQQMMWIIIFPMKKQSRSRFSILKWSQMAPMHQVKKWSWMKRRKLRR